MQVKHKLLISIQGIFLFLIFSNSSAWTIEENYDAHQTGKQCGTMWTGSGSPPNNRIVSDAKSSSGNNSCQFWIEKGSKGPYGGGFYHPKALVKGDEIWLRLRVYMPQGYDYTAQSEGENLKFLRFRIISGVDRTNHGFDDWYLLSKQHGSGKPFGYIYEGHLAWTYFGSDNDVIQLGNWETYEFNIKFDNVPESKGGKARVRIWKNGKLLAEVTNSKTLKTVDTIVTDTLLFSYWNGGSPATQKLYVDDIVLTTDMPSMRDKNGNPYIGMGDFQSQAPPSPPAIN